jgi:N-acetylmuramoyl-L-alanine amidase
VSTMQNRAASLRHEAEVEFLARALLAETDGRSLRGMEALAAIVVNRLRAARSPGGPTWWGTELGRVVAHDDAFPAGPRAPRDDETEALAACRRIAARAAVGALPDPTRGATRWHHVGSVPSWADGHAPTLVVGSWVFYRVGA